MQAHTKVTRPVRGLEFRWAQFRIAVRLFRLALGWYGHLPSAVKAVKALLAHGKKVALGRPLAKGFEAGGRYGWDAFNPLWPSPGFDRFMERHLEEVFPSAQPRPFMRRMLVALTKKCPLNCEHCSEGPSLNQRDILTRTELEQHIGQWVGQGVAHMVYSGGEPLSRWDDLIYLTETFRDRCSQWVFTSGWGLTPEKAVRLRAAGIDGVAISLDHFDEAAHNRFRRNPKAFDWARKAVEACKGAGLVTTVNLCPTHDFLAGEPMHSYMELMKNWQVDVVNIIEPRAAGYYDGKPEVELSEDEKTALQVIADRFNLDPAYRDYPLLTYHGAARKLLRCGGGVSYLFLDYDGTVYPCPFCRKPLEAFGGNREAACQAARNLELVTASVPS
jgi:MoaA/NifB/PqqE/SkfB family radical SAM enzyme